MARKKRVYHRDAKGRFATMEKSVKDRRRKRSMDRKSDIKSKVDGKRVSRRKASDIYSEDGSLKKNLKGRRIA